MSDATVNSRPLHMQGKLFGPSLLPIRLLLDLDGTLLHNAAAPVLSRYFGKQMPAGHPPAWFNTGLLAKLHITPRTFWAAFAKNEEEIYSQAVLMPGAAECLHQIKNNGAFIAVVTARRPSAEGITRRWLAKHNVPYDVLEMGHDDKLPVARQYRLNWAIEDDTAVAAALAAELHVLLMSPPQKTNRSLRTAGVTPVTSWAEVTRLLPTV